MLDHLQLLSVRLTLQQCRKRVEVVVALLVLLALVAVLTLGPVAGGPKAAAPANGAARVKWTEKAAAHGKWIDADGFLTRQIRFLHIPKCGTTFKRTMIATTSVCRGLMERSVRTADGCGHSGMKMLEEARGGVSLEDAGEDGRQCCHMVVGFHQPWSAPGKPPERGGAIYATVVRDPFERVVSAFHYGHHAYFPKSNETEQLRSLVLDHLSDDPQDEPSAIAAYSSLTAASNCATKMLAGYWCAQAVGVHDAMLQVSLDHLRALQFVGLTEQWRATICLFHAMFGLSEPRWDFQAENTRPQNYSRFTQRDTPAWAELEKLVRFNERYDEKVYREGKAIFYRNLEAFPQCKTHLTHQHR